MPSIAELILLSLLFLDILTIIAIMIVERKDPYKVLAWSVIVIILPIIGSLGYLLIGQRNLLYGMYAEKRRFEEKQVDDEEIPDYLKGLKGVDSTVMNRSELFTNGKELFRRMINDMKNAEKSIIMEFYIMMDDDLGREIKRLLCRKAEEGLVVMIIGDGFGFRKLPKTFIDEMKASKVRIVLYNRTGIPSLDPRKNNCDHRKVIVIDGRIAYCGGFNLCSDYIGMGHLGNWRDSAVRIEGDISRKLEKRMLATWCYSVKSPMEKTDDCLFHSEFNERVTLIYGGPDLRPNPILSQYLGMIENAKRRILLHTPYFLNTELIHALMKASESGVDVRVIIPGRPDHWFTFWNNYRCASIAMKSGVKFYLYRDGFMHSKTMMVDDEICSIGSANFDDRSAYYNFESNVMLFSKGIIEKSVYAFDEDVSSSDELHQGDYSGIVPSIKMFICNIVRPLA